MVIYKKYTTDAGIERVLAYSDKNVYIERDGIEYSSADDFAWQNRTYTETDKPIDSGDNKTIIEQKAEAFDHLTGGDSNE